MKGIVACIHPDLVIPFLSISPQEIVQIVTAVYVCCQMLILGQWNMNISIFILGKGTWLYHFYNDSDNRAEVTIVKQLLSLTPHWQVLPSPGCHPEVLLDEVAHDSQGQEGHEEHRCDIGDDSQSWDTEQCRAAQALQCGRDMLREGRVRKGGEFFFSKLLKNIYLFMYVCIES